MNKFHRRARNSLQLAREEIERLLEQGDDFDALNACAMDRLSELTQRARDELCFGEIVRNQAADA